MKRLRMIKSIIAVTIIVGILSGMVISTSAANISFAFNLGNTGTSLNRYTGASNTKLYVNQSATVRTYYNNAPGYGFRFVMQCSDPTVVAGYAPIVTATAGGWISGADKVYLSYLSGMAQANHNYYVAGRIDNDYSGTYSCNGYFNSDQVD